jgi:hypothetical protein
MQFRPQVHGYAHCNQRPSYPAEAGGLCDQCCARKDQAERRLRDAEADGLLPAFAGETLSAIDQQIDGDARRHAGNPSCEWRIPIC